MIDRCPRLFIPRNEISPGLTYDLIKISRQPVAGRFAFFSFFFFFSCVEMDSPWGNGGDFFLSFFFFFFFLFAAIIGFRAADEIGDGSDGFRCFSQNKRAAPRNEPTFIIISLAFSRSSKRFSSRFAPAVYANFLESVKG